MYLLHLLSKISYLILFFCFLLICMHKRDDLLGLLFWNSWVEIFLRTITFFHMNIFFTISILITFSKEAIFLHMVVLLHIQYRGYLSLLLTLIFSSFLSPSRKFFKSFTNKFGYMRTYIYFRLKGTSNAALILPIWSFPISF